MCDPSCPTEEDCSHHPGEGAPLIAGDLRRLTPPRACRDKRCRSGGLLRDIRGEVYHPERVAVGWGEPKRTRSITTVAYKFDAKV